MTNRTAGILAFLLCLVQAAIMIAAIKSQPETYATCDESHGRKKFNPIRIKPPQSSPYRHH